jgi:hypothetical protein
VRQSTPSSTYLLPSAHVDAIFQYRVKRALPLSSFTHLLSAPGLLPPPVPPPTLFFLSFRLAPSLLSPGERENGSEARNEKKGRKESGGRRGWSRGEKWKREREIERERERENESEEVAARLQRERTE